MDKLASWRVNAIDLAAERPFRVGGARIDPVSHEIEIAGRRERLQPQNLKVLVALVRRKGEVVTRVDLADSCWGGRIIGEDVINHSIFVLRALAERAGGFSIETVPKAGYRLVEDKSRAASLRAAAALLTLVLVFAAATFLTGRFNRQGQPPMPTIAMLPLAAAPDAATRELAVATADSLSRTLSEGNFAVKLVDRQPNADRSIDLLVSGNVFRDGNSARATIRVEEVARRVLVYSKQFEATGDEIGILPERIGAQVAAMLSWTGGLMVLDRREPLEPQIASALMKQMALTIEEADNMRSYQIGRVIAPRAPNSAIVQLSLAMSTARALGDLPRSERASALTVGRRAARRARELAPEFGDVYIPWCLFHSPVRMMECDVRLRHSMRVDPGSSFAPGLLSTLLYNAGRIDDAIKLADVSRANDPYKPAKLARMVRMLEAAGRSTESERLYRAAMRWWPGNHRIVPSRFAGMVERGNYMGLEGLLSASGDEALPLDRAAALEVLGALRTRDAERASRACAGDALRVLTLAFCMTSLADLGDFDGAFSQAQKLYPALRAAPGADPEQVWLDDPVGYYTAVLSGDAAKSLRTDPRYLVVAHKLGLLAYWRSGPTPDFCTKTREPICAKIYRKG